jgi:hypothetical protein
MQFYFPLYYQKETEYFTVNRRIYDTLVYFEKNEDNFLSEQISLYLINAEMVSRRMSLLTAI